MNMTPEEQRALVQFFGTMHAQAKQTDQMIVGSSQFVKPVSPSIQHQLEQALRIPVQADVQQTPPQQYIEPTILHAIEAPQLIQEPFMVEQPYTAPVEEASPVIFNKDVVDILKEINLNLARIGDILEKKNGTSKKTKASKSD